MLRTARSLPSLRLLYQQESVALKQTQQKQTLFTSSYAHVTTELVEPSFGSVRHVHQTSKKEVFLLDSTSNRTKYTTMNLQGLKMECKKRGLKVSGRKLDLVQRLVSQDQIGVESARSFSHYTEQGQNKVVEPSSSFFSKDSVKNIKKPVTDNSFDNNSQHTKNILSSAKEKILEKMAKDKEKLSAKQASKASKKLLKNKTQETSESNLKKENAKLQLKEEARAFKEANAKRTEELKLQAEKKAELEKKETERLREITKKVAHEAREQEIASKTLQKAQAQSKANTIKLAREQLQSKARVEQKQSEKEKESNFKQESHKDHQKSNDFTSRDVKFFAAFGLSTLGWWSLKDTTV